MEENREAFTAAEVVAAVLERLAEDDRPFERLQLQQATPTEYMGRIYRDSSDDYEGIFIQR